MAKSLVINYMVYYALGRTLMHICVWSNVINCYRVAIHVVRCVVTARRMASVVLNVEKDVYLGRYSL